MPGLFVWTQLYTMGESDLRDISAIWLTPNETALLFVYGWLIIPI